MNKNSIFIIFIICIICLICFSLVMYLLYKVMYKVIYKVYKVSTGHNIDDAVNRFADIPNSTMPSATTDITNMSIPTEKACDGGSNLITYCMNYNGCCSQNNIGNSCFCNHPFVMNCKNNYDSCKGNDCQAELKKCCMSYNNINIDSNNFKKPILQDQQSKRICSINSINMDTKCMELCQTNTNCKAYSLDDINCILFSDIDPLPNNANYKTKTNYFIKK